ncbi:MAG: hypothetical protein IT437_00165 [Phycisphaerales bacterium]|nr:hypothetical protein [Phycisphaerales bacterium]
MTRVPYSRRGALGHAGMLLLEVVAAIAVFVMGGMAILSLVGGSADSLSASRDAVKAVDLARSGMARLEAGLATPQNLPGPVPLWDDDADAWLGDDSAPETGGFADAAPRPSGWELEVATEPSRFAGLTLVTVTAVKRSGETVAASYTLRQLVRLGRGGEEGAGELEDFVEEGP